MAAHSRSNSYRDGPKSYQDGPGEKDQTLCWHDSKMRKVLHSHLRGPSVPHTPRTYAPHWGPQSPFVMLQFAVCSFPSPPVRGQWRRREVGGPWGNSVSNTAERASAHDPGTTPLRTCADAPPPPLAVQGQGLHHSQSPSVVPQTPPLSVCGGGPHRSAPAPGPQGSWGIAPVRTGHQPGCPDAEECHWLPPPPPPGDWERVGRRFGRLWDRVGEGWDMVEEGCERVEEDWERVGEV